MFKHLTATRCEIALVLLLTFLGGVLRCWSFGRLSLSHFDEGIYALAGLWSLEPKGLTALDPTVVPYAPPGFPILVGCAYVLWGVSDQSALAVSVLCGIATIPVAAWMARRTFGPGAGAAAAVFSALSLAHIAFSRQALTDSPFLLVWLLALGLGARFLERPGVGRALALGLAVGLAQLFKYNGWLAGATVLVSALLGVVTHPDERRPSSLARTFGWSALAIASAGLAYWPWFQFVQAHGGYAGLLRHQRAYTGGVASWWPHWNQQLAQLTALSGGGPWRFLAWSLAFLAWGVVSHRERIGLAISRRGCLLWGGCFLGGAVLYVPLAAFPWWIGLGWFPWLIRDQRPAVRLVVIWWLLLSVLTPFYHPYARLWLPLHAAGWVLVAGFVVRLGVSENPTPGTLGKWSRRQWAALLTCWLLGMVQVIVANPRPFPPLWVFEPSPSFRAFVLERLASSSSVRGNPRGAADHTMRILARRPLAFYLVLQGRYSVRLEPGPERLLSPPLDGERLVLDKAVLGPDWSPIVSKVLRFWKHETTFREQLDPVTLLDVHPDSAFAMVPNRENEVWLFSARSPPEGPR